MTITITDSRNKIDNVFNLVVDDSASDALYAAVSNALDGLKLIQCDDCGDWYPSKQIVEQPNCPMMYCTDCMDECNGDF